MELCIAFSAKYIEIRQNFAYSVRSNIKITTTIGRIKNRIQIHDLEWIRI